MEIFLEIVLFLEMTTKFAVRQMTSIRSLLCEALVGNVDLGSKNASQENTCMSSQMGHQLSIMIWDRKMQTKYNKHQFIPCQNVGLSLLRHGLGIFSTMKQIYKQCTQCLIPLFKDMSDINI